MMEFIKKHKNLLLITIGIAILIFAGIFYYQLIRIQTRTTEGYFKFRLVDEKISQSAPIKIYLPLGINKEIAKNLIKFEPEIKGKWIDDNNLSFIHKLISNLFAEALAKNQNNTDLLIFKPYDKLQLNQYYQVSLNLPTGEILKDEFYVVEDPEVANIFPQENSEAPEDSEITIVFNRPIVPITTLDYLEIKKVPVEIYPQTSGKFRWISTNVLQFIPEKRLIRASKYTVEVKNNELISLDGLPVKGKRIEFFTRRLRLSNLPPKTLTFDQPLIFEFNQPIDLEKTKQEIKLIDKTTNKEIPFIVSYLDKKFKITNSYLDLSSSDNLFKNYVNLLKDFSPKLLAGFYFKTSGTDLDQDRSKNFLLILPLSDKYGRKQLWDFDSQYFVEIKKVYPLEGDLILNNPITFDFSVVGIVKNISQENSQFGINKFDPRNSLIVEFFEAVDLRKSEIIGEKIESINYLENNDNPDDKHKIVKIKFSEKLIVPGEVLTITFKKIYNEDGLLINKEPISYNVQIYPPLVIYNTFPADNSKEASVGRLIICSNNPLTIPDKKHWNEVFQSNKDLIYLGGYWAQSDDYQYLQIPKDFCPQDKGYLTVYNYRLLPYENYLLELKLTDIFGQRLKWNLAFQTGDIPSEEKDIISLQEQTYNVTNSQKTKLKYAVKNIDSLYVEICKTTPLNLLNSFLKYYYYYYSEIPKCLAHKSEVIKIKPKYWLYDQVELDIKTFFEDPRGYYFVRVYNPNIVDYTGKGRYIDNYFNITDLVVLNKSLNISKEVLMFNPELNLKNLIWVAKLPNLEGVNGADIEYYTYKKDNEFKNIKLKKEATTKTNENGLVWIDPSGDSDGEILIINDKKGDSTIVSSIQDFSYIYKQDILKKFYIYTDKPIYRPEQEVYFKVIYRIGYDGNYKILKNHPLAIEVRNSQNKVIYTQTLKTNDFGNVYGNFKIPKDSPLGWYSICIKDTYNCGNFEVLEYVPAAFKLEAKSLQKEYISTDEVKVNLEARYYFDMPVDSADIEYTISSQNYYFDKYPDSSFSFGYFSYGDYDYENYYNDKYIKNGKSKLDVDGKGIISEKLDLNKIFKDDYHSKIIIFDITAKNSLNQSVSTQESLILHRGEFYLGVKTNKFFVAKKEPFTVFIKSIDIEGKPIFVSNLNLNINKLEWLETKRQEADGNFYYKYELKKTPISNFIISTNQSGDAKLETFLEKEGTYELELIGKDKRGNIIKSNLIIYVWGEAPDYTSINRERGLDLKTDKRDLKVGEKAKVLIISPFDYSKAFITIERGRIFDYQIKEIKGNFGYFEFEVKDKYVPNIFVSVVNIAPSGEVFYRNIEFNIDKGKYKLNLNINPNKKYYLPGEKVILNINVTDELKRPVKSEVSIAAVDMSVLALKGNPKKDPLSFFYRGLNLAINTLVNFKDYLRYSVLEDLYSEGTKGGGGGEESLLAVKKRGIFKETAFWIPDIVTDDYGRARIEFILPDNLTTWQIEGLGVTEDTKLGVDYQEIITQKNLMVSVLKPRFVIPGDEFLVGAKLFNNTESNLLTKVNFESKDLILSDDKNKIISIKSKTSNDVFFKVKVPDNFDKELSEFNITAQSGELIDSIDSSIKVFPDETYEVRSTSNFTQSNQVKEYVYLPVNIIKGKGQIKINYSASLVSKIFEGFKSLIEFPYGCTEQISSKLYSLAIIKKYLQIPAIANNLKIDKIKFEGKEYSLDEAIKVGLSKLYQNQNYDGGFSFWQEGKSNFYVTLEVIKTLSKLKEAGVEIDQQVLDHAIGYVFGSLSDNSYASYYPYNYINPRIDLINTISVLSEIKYTIPEGILSKIAELVKDEKFLNDDLNNHDLIRLAIILERLNFPYGDKEKVYKLITNRIKIDSRGAFVPVNKKANWYAFETPIKNTSLYLKLIILRNERSPLTEKMIRWIFHSQNQTGDWGSTQNTLAVIDALSDYLNWTEEYKANFELEIKLNDKLKQKEVFTPENAFEIKSLIIPLKEMLVDRLNSVALLKKDKLGTKNSLYYDMELLYYLKSKDLSSRDEGFTILRGFYKLDDKKAEKRIFEVNAGEILRARIKIIVPKERRFVAIEDRIPAGMEIVNLDLATEQKSLRLQEKELKGRELEPSFKEIRDDRLFLFIENLSPGVYEYEYFVRALNKGKYLQLPSKVWEMYFPENFGRTETNYFLIK